MTATLTQEVLKQLLHYDRKTGVFTWISSPGGRIRIGDTAGSLLVTHGRPYRYIGLYWREHTAARLAYLYVRGRWPAGLMGYRDGNTLNTAWENLEVQSPSKNQHKGLNTAAGTYAGVHLSKSGQYVARIKINGVKREIFRSDSRDQAHMAYLWAKLAAQNGLIQ